MDPQTFDPAKPFQRDDPPLTVERPNVWQRMQASNVRKEAGLPDNVVSPEVRAKLMTPLGHPTGIDLIDSQTSPLNLATTALIGRTAVKQAAFKAISGLVETAGAELAPDIIGLLSPRTAHALRIAQKVGKVVTKDAAAAGPSTLPELIDQAVADGKLRRAPEGTPPVQRGWGGRPVKPMPPIAPVPEVPPPAPERAASAGTRMKLTAPETDAFFQLVKRGMKPADALQSIATQRELLAKFPGLPSSSTVATSVADRNTTGKW